MKTFYTLLKTVFEKTGAAVGLQLFAGVVLVCFHSNLYGVGMPAHKNHKRPGGSAASTANAGLNANPAKPGIFALPAISYSGPQIYHINTAIIPLTPTNNGGAVAVPGYNNLTQTLASGVSSPIGVAVDVAGNVYVALRNNSTITKIPFGGGTPIQIGSGLSTPYGVAVDIAGNVYVADYGSNSAKKILVSDGSTVTIGTGFSNPNGIAVDVLGNVYVGDSGNSAVKEIPVGGGAQIILGAGSGLPFGVAVDMQGNVYFCDAGSSLVKKIPVGGGVPITLGLGFNQPDGLAVDAAGNVFVADAANNAVKEIPVSGGSPISLGSGLNGPQYVAVDGAGNVYVTDNNNSAVKKILPTGGCYLNTALPPGLAIDAATGIITGTPTALFPSTDYVITAYNSSGSTTATINLTVSGPLPVVSYSSPQSYSVNAAITPLVPASSFETPAGYANPPVNFATGFTHTRGIAIDAQGNVFIADFGSKLVKKFPVGGGAPITITSGALGPVGVAVDYAGNVYVADYTQNTIIKVPVGGGNPVTISSGYGAIIGIAADASGNVYAPDYGTGVIKKIPPGGGATVTIASGFSNPSGIAVDSLGNVYISDYTTSLITKIPPGGGAFTTLGSGFHNPYGLTVDASGNVFVADYNHDSMTEIPAGGGPAVTLNSSFNTVVGAVADAAGDVIVADYGNPAVLELKPSGGFYINTPLPAGLSFSNATGAISGTPVTPSPATNYTVTAYNLNGAATATVNISVTPTANLSALKLSAGALIPGFSTGTASYTANVANSVSFITVTPTTSDASATVKVNGSTVASGTASGAIPLAEGVQTVITIVVTARDGITNKTYTVTVTRASSTNANLSTLGQSIGGLTPAFSSTTTSYTSNVSNATATITLKPVSSDANATIKVNGTAVTSGTKTAPITLSEGAQTVITTAVTAQNGTTTKTYTLTVTRAPSANAALSGIRLSNGTLSPAFATVTTSYIAGVANTVSTITITPTSTDANATIKVNGTTVTSGTASTPIALAEGAQTAITTVVTAQDGSTNKTYTVTVARGPSANANLSTLGQSLSGLTPAFSSATTSYTINVSNAIATITLKPVSSDANATIQVNGTAAISGTKTAPIELAVGPNTITIAVTAQNGTTNKTYTLTVTRASGGTDGYVPIAIGTGISVTKPIETPQIAEDGIQVHQGVSPNGDGINDFLQIDNISQYPDNKLMIINRNGQLIYETQGYDNGSKVFDGHNNKNGQMQLPGTYFYQLDYTANGITKHKTGFIVLKY